MVAIGVVVEGTWEMGGLDADGWAEDLARPNFPPFPFEKDGRGSDIREGRAWGGFWAGAGSGRVGGAEGGGRVEHLATKGRGTNDSGRTFAGALDLATGASPFWIFLALIWPLRSGTGTREGIGAGALAILSKAARTRFFERLRLRSLFRA